MEEVATYRAWLWIAQGNLTAAECWAQTVQVHPDEHLDTLDEFKALTLVRVLLARGKPDAAAPLLERLLRAAESEGRMGKAIEILALPIPLWPNWKPFDTFLLTIYNEYES